MTSDGATAVRRLVLPALAAYVRHSPEHRGHWRLASLAVAWAPLLKDLARPKTVRLREGFRLIVDGRSQTGRIAYATGRYEPAITALIRTVVRPNDAVVDVGANIGYFSLLSSRAVGPDGRVLAFEPAPMVRTALLANLALNRTRNVTVHDVALGAGDGEVRFFCGPEKDSGLGSLRRLDDGTEIDLLTACGQWAGAGPIDSSSGGGEVLTLGCGVDTLLSIQIAP